VERGRAPRRRAPARRCAGADDAAHGPDGVAAALGDGLLADGTWFEGDNYHQFAHRGLWFGLTLAARAGIAPDPALVDRFERGFAAPFLVAMPGPTLPARRDAQFGTSLRQWRWAEWLELGTARAPAGEAADFLAGWLGALYAPAPALGRDTGRWRASGEAERNEPAAALSRADLGWKSLLFAPIEAPPVGGGDAGARAGPVLLREQGLAVLRGRGRGAYVSLDYGPPGGGHGHADRLNVQLPPLVLDPGAGSYVDRTLHWYRSTLAHAAPLVDGRSQPPVEGRLLAYDVASDPGFQVAAAEAPVAPGVVARRWLVLADGYLVDRLTWTGLGDRTLDLPLGGAVRVEAERRGGRADGAGEGGGWRPAERRGAGGLEDGFDFLADVEEQLLDPAGARLRVGARGVADTVADEAGVFVVGPPGALLWRATAPGAPGHAAGPMCALRARGDSGAFTVVWDLGAGTRVTPGTGDALAVSLAVSLADGSRHRHLLPARDGSGTWEVRSERVGERPHDVRFARDGASAVPAAPPAAVARWDARGAPVDLPGDGSAVRFVLGEPQYHRSEDAWEDAGRPTARVALAVRDDRLHVSAEVRLGRPPSFVDPAADNPLDNERAGVNGDGLQLHLGVVVGEAVESVGGWLLVPAVPGPGVAVTRTTAPGPVGDAAAPAATWAAAWAAADGGWTLDASLPLGPLRARAAAARVAPAAALAVLVNEAPAGRERRRGQLVLDGTWPARAAEGFIYLRGDRYDAARGLLLRLPPAP
jgi:hypothetical protein